MARSGRSWLTSTPVRSNSTSSRAMSWLWGGWTPSYRNQAWRVFSRVCCSAHAQVAAGNPQQQLASQASGAVINRSTSESGPASPRALEPNRRTAAAGINWRMAAAVPASRCSIGADRAKLMESFYCSRLAPPSHACCHEAFRQRSCRRRSDGVSTPGCRWAASLSRGSLRRCFGRTLGAGMAAGCAAAVLRQIELQSEMEEQLFPGNGPRRRCRSRPGERGH